MSIFRTLAVQVAILALATCTAAAQHEHALVASSEDGGGSLLVDYPFDETVVRVSEVVCLGGMCLYSSISPSLVSEPQGGDELPEGLHPLSDGTALSLEIVALDPFVSVKFDDRVLRTPGSRGALGTAPGLHAHPVWQVTAPEGVRGTYPLSLRVVTTSAQYRESPVYTLRFSNAPAVSPSPTATATPTAAEEPSPTATSVAATATATVVATGTPSRRATPTSTSTRTPTGAVTPSPGVTPVAGDANCDRRVGAADLVAATLHQAASPQAPPCAPVTRDAVIALLFGP